MPSSNRDHLRGGVGNGAAGEPRLLVPFAAADSQGEPAEGTPPPEHQHSPPPPAQRQPAQRPHRGRRHRERGRREERHREQSTGGPRPSYEETASRGLPLVLRAAELAYLKGQPAEALAALVQCRTAEAACALALMYHGGDEVIPKVRIARGYDRLRGFVLALEKELQMIGQPPPQEFERFRQSVFREGGEHWKR